MDENEQGGKYRGEPRWGRGRDEGLKRRGRVGSRAATKCSGRVPHYFHYFPS